MSSLANIEKHVLAVVHDFLSEIGNERARKMVNLNASLDRDLGIGSLERTELFYRLEKAFSIKLPASLLTEAVTLRDIVATVNQTQPTQIQYQPQYVAALESAHTQVDTANTLVEVLWRYAKQEPKRPHIYLQDEQGQEHIINYGQLLEKANATAIGLYARGLKQGETVALMLPTSDEFFFAFFGILLAGGVPVPIYPPFRPEQIEEYSTREAKILCNAEVRFLITFHKAEILSKLLKTFIPSLKEVTTVPALMSSRGDLPDIIIENEDPALIQYTSGSTGTPKGVLLSHHNLLANIRAYGQAIGMTPHDAIVSWLPLYHDMGLIGAWLGSLYYGIPLTLLSPLSFLASPERWLWAIHYHRATLTAGPNFAYELCTHKIDDNALEGLDLSSLRLCLNGAEAIYAKTIRGFIQRFTKYSLKPEALFPVYGLAESAVALTFPPLGRSPRIDKIVRQAFESSGQAIPAANGEKDYLEFVACGKPIPGHYTRVVNDAGEALPERRLGSLQFKGPSAMQGYYHNAKATQAIYHDGWWDTGDFAYISDEEIFITGRKKDMIIKAGRNLYPAEIEELSMQAEGIRKGCVAAFGVTDTNRGTEKLIIVAETRETNSAKRNRIIKQVNQAIMSTLGIPPDQVVLVRPGKIPKTSSGKLRRADCKKAYLKKELGFGHVPFWWQIARLSLMGAWKKIEVWGSKTARFIYTLYADLMLSVTAFLVWLSLLLLPVDVTRKLVQLWGRVIFRLIGCPIQVEGRENLLKHAPQVIVANHSSYVDVAILLGILPKDTLFIAKQELLNAPVIRTFIKKLGHLTVDRMDFSKSSEDVNNIIAALSSHSILIFPEGTFTYATGMRPFKLGAFKVAAETGKAILPIALKGTRKFLRSGSKLLRPCVIKIKILEPLLPKNNSWEEILRLRNESRAEIAKYCGELTLDFVIPGPEIKPEEDNRQ